MIEIRFSGWEYSQFVKCPAFTAQYDIQMQGSDISTSSELTPWLQGLRVWGQHKAEIYHRDIPDLLRPGLTGGWGGSRSVSPPDPSASTQRAKGNLCLCGSWSHQGVEQPEPANGQSQNWCHQLVWTTELPCASQNLLPTQFPELPAGVGLLGCVPADTLQACPSCRISGMPQNSCRSTSPAQQSH